MTTIAYRKGTIAADSMAVSGDTKSSTTKIFLLPKQIIGFCGYLAFGLIFVDWVKGGKKVKDKPSWKDTLSSEVEFSALVLDKKGCVTWDELMRPYPLEDEFTAIGSGSDVALGALYMGATARQAVEAASKFNAFTGGKIITYSIKDLK